jgi:hypothetical protein
MAALRRTMKRPKKRVKRKLLPEDKEEDPMFQDDETSLGGAKEANESN